jgi:hypothetical protein
MCGRDLEGRLLICHEMQSHPTHFHTENGVTIYIRNVSSTIHDNKNYPTIIIIIIMSEKRALNPSKRLVYTAHEQNNDSTYWTLRHVSGLPM